MPELIAQPEGSQREEIESLLLLSHDLYWEQDEDFRFTRITARDQQSHLFKLFQQHLGQTLQEAGFQSVGSGSWKALRRRLGAEACRDIILASQDAQDRRLILSMTAEPVVQNGQLSGYRGVLDDITRKHLNEEDMVRFRAAMDASEDMLFFVDRETMKYTYINDTALARSGFTREEMLKMGPHDTLAVSREELARGYDELIHSETGGSTIQMPAYYQGRHIDDHRDASAGPVAERPLDDHHDGA